MSTFKKISESEYITVCELLSPDKTYHIYETKKRANKLTKIKCDHDTISWIQLPAHRLIAGGYSIPILNVSNLRKDVTNIVVIKGVPKMISGLDDGPFLSYTNKKDGHYIYVMTKRRLKEFLK